MQHGLTIQQNTPERPMSSIPSIQNTVMQGPMMMDNPYAAEVITARQRIGRLKERLSHRAAARRDFFANGAKTEDAPPPDDQAWSYGQTGLL